MPPTKIVAVVQGDLYRNMASHSMARAAEVIGCPVHTLDVPVGEDLWLFKLSLLERFDEPLLCIDVDLVFRKWSWDPFRRDRFNAVLDYPLKDWKHGAPHFEKLYPISFAVNGGLWYAPPTAECKSMFALARYHYEHTLKDFRYKMGDQTALNLALREMETPVHLLPNDYNFQVPAGSPRLIRHQHSLPSSVFVAHCIGETFAVDGKVPNPNNKLRRLQQMLSNNPAET